MVVWLAIVSYVKLSSIYDKRTGPTDEVAQRAIRTDERKRSNVTNLPTHHYLQGPTNQKRQTEGDHRSWISGNIFPRTLLLDLKLAWFILYPLKKTSFTRTNARWLACTLVAMEAGFKHLLQPPMLRDLGERTRRNLRHSSEIWPCTREPSVAFLQKTTRPSHPFRPSDPPVRPTRKCDGRTDRKFAVGITSRNAVGEKRVFEYKIRNMIAPWD